MKPLVLVAGLGLVALGVFVMPIALASVFVMALLLVAGGAFALGVWKLAVPVAAAGIFLTAYLWLADLLGKQVVR